MNTCEELVTYFCGIGDQTGSLICQVISLPVSYAPRHEPREGGFATSIKTVLLAENAESVGPLSWGWVWGIQVKAGSMAQQRPPGSSTQPSMCKGVIPFLKEETMPAFCKLCLLHSLSPGVYFQCSINCVATCGGGRMTGWSQFPQYTRLYWKFNMPGFGGIVAPSAHTDISCGCGKTNFA